MSSVSKPSKRLDLQGIRGLAIISVLLFHFYPDQFPNGYLGVDQFFVLSGFLMCMLLKRAEKESPCSLVILFYSKRFKRILPLYILLILLSVIALYSFFPDSSIVTNTKSASRALLFVSNVPKGEEDDYFEQIANSIDIFSHTWSLSVEVQYYFLVPVMFLLVSRFSARFQYFLYTVIGGISFFFYTISNDTVAFNSVFARIWQFVIGMLVYLITASTPKKEYMELKNEEEMEDGVGQKFLVVETEELEGNLDYRGFLVDFLKYLFLLAFLMITVCPMDLPVLIFRPFVTVITAMLMLISEDDKVMSNRVLTYIGDISYSLYLIHWPICAYCRMDSEVVSQYAIFTGLITSIILAIITFESFEKWYLKISSTSIGILTLVLFLLSVVAVNRNEIVNWIEKNDVYNDKIDKNFTSLDGVTKEMTIEDAKLLNHKWNVNDVINLMAPSCEYERPSTPLGWCKHEGLSPNGKYKIMIFGNSWTANHANLFYQECGYKANTILQESEGACEPFYPTHRFKNCPSQVEKFREHVEREKPDIGVIITRFMDIGAPLPSENAKNHTDNVYEIMLKNTQKLLPNIKKKLYILNAIPFVRENKVEQIVPELQKGMDPVDIDKILVDPRGYELARKRYSRLLKDCKGKCELIDYLPTFYNKTTKTIRYFDERGFSFISSGNHITPRGLEEVRPVWKEFCEKL